MIGLPDDAENELASHPHRRPTVAIIPPEAGPRYRRLLRALEEAVPVRFVGSTGAEIDSADAAIVFGGGRPRGLRAMPCLVLAGGDADVTPGSSFCVQIARSPGIDRMLRGRRLTEHRRRPPAPVATGAATEVLAVVGGAPVWVRDAAAGTETVSAQPAELRDGEFLRDHMMAGRFWGLLAIVLFLRRISSDGSETSRALRACFVIDDPNVRLSSYGYVRYPELARDAREHGYHVAVATIPLDLVLPGRRGLRVFREHRSHLSLVVHGNDHVHRELDRRRGGGEAERVITAAVERVRRFERRAGVRVERVMCPPHGACGPEALGALFRHGFLALAASRPFPWDAFSDHDRWRLGGWLPAQLTAGGLPVIPRLALGRGLDDLLFRAILELPIVLYCHHTDLRAGLEPFRTAAARVADLGDVEWTSLAAIARRNVVVCEQDGRATVTVYSRDARLRRPRAPAIHIEIPRRYGGGDVVQLSVDGDSYWLRTGSDGRAGITLPNAGGGTELHIRVDGPEPTTAATFGDWRPRAWPLARRAMTETRDRALPVFKRR